jgi:biopolymer transport protein ExbD
LRVPAESGLPGEIVERPKKEEPEEEVMRFARRWQTDEEVDMTPMIDMTFLLLIFFMVTASFALQKSLEIPAPQTTAPSQPEPIEQEESEEIVVTIEADDNVMVGDVPAPTRNELIAQLREAREGGGERSNSTLRVQASGDARHATVVMVLDVGSLVGMDSVQLQIENEEE